MAIIAITFIMFLTFIFFPNCINRVFYESDIGLGLVTFLLAWRLKKVHWSVALMFLICSCSVILLMNDQEIYQHPLPEPYHFKLAAITVSTYVTLLIFGIVPFLLDGYFSKIMTMLFIAAVVNAAWMLVRARVWGPDQCYAMLSNSAIDASFIACLAPIALWLIDKEKRKYLQTSGEMIGTFCLIIMVSAILVSKSSTGIAGLGIATASYLFMVYGIKSFKTIIPLAFAISSGAYIYLREELLNPNGRFRIWQDAFAFYWNETHRAIGAGIGTFFMWGPEIQRHNNNTGGPKMALFIWMHNDWLQVLFEMGIIGLAGLIILYSCLLHSSWKKKNALFPILCTYGFIALTQMPLRAFPFQLLGACIIMLSFEKINRV